MKVVNGQAVAQEDGTKGRTFLVNAPGRLNLIGEHTDYNGGKVLPFCINRSVQIRLVKTENGGDLIRVTAQDLGEVLEVARAELPVDAAALPSQRWTHYVLGCLSLFFGRELEVPGDLYVSITGDLPLGAGLSSSAALCTGLLSVFEAAFRRGGSKDEVARLAQKVEHEYAGTKCGLMDQLAILYGKSDTLLKIAFTGNAKSGFELEPVLAHSKLSEYDVVVLNSNVAHALASSEYNVRRGECDELVSILNRKSGKAWKNVSQIGEAGIFGPEPEVCAPFSTLVEHVKDVSRIIGGDGPHATLLAKRAVHVISENLRVEAAVEAIRNGDLLSLNVLLNNAHESLAQLYEVSCPEIEALRSDVLEFSRSVAPMSGGSPLIIGPRMCGGGFGGSLINLVHRTLTGKFVQQFDLSDRYRHLYGVVPACFVVQISEGLTVQISEGLTVQ